VVTGREPRWFEDDGEREEADEESGGSYWDTGVGGDVLEFLCAVSEPWHFGWRTATYVPGGGNLTAPNGASDYGYVAIDIPGGVPLNEITSFSYTVTINSAGSGGFAPELIFEIDCDGDGLEGLGGAQWMKDAIWPLIWATTTSCRETTGLRAERSARIRTRFPTTTSGRPTMPATASVFLDTWANLTDGTAPLPAHGIDLNDKVYRIVIAAGTSGSFNGMDVTIPSVSVTTVQGGKRPFLWKSLLLFRSRLRWPWSASACLLLSADVTFSSPTSREALDRTGRAPLRFRPAFRTIARRNRRRIATLSL